MNELPQILTEHFAALNRLDAAAVLATFADDALLLSSRGACWGKEAIAKWIAREIIDDKVSVAIVEVIDRHGDTLVRVRYDGIFDRTNLPAEVVLTQYFRVQGGKITELILTFVQP
jgi:hypothetical protein